MITGLCQFTKRVLLSLPLLLTCSIIASAADSNENLKPKPEGAGESHVQQAELGAADETAVSYVLYRDSLSFRDHEAPAKPLQSTATFSPEPATGNTVDLALKLRSAGFSRPYAVSTVPMTPGEKFMMFLTRSFKPVGPYAMSIFSGAFNELFDDDNGRDSSFGDYAGDVGTRAARSMAFRTTANFFEKFAYPTVFGQDPRYHRSSKTSVGGKIGYAVSRLFVTQGDRSGDQFNVSYIMGGLTAAAISNVWVRDEHRTVEHSLKRWGVHLGLTAFNNLVREFLGGQ